MSEWTPPEPSRRRRYIAIAAALAAMVTIVLVVVSLQSDDPDSAASQSTVPQTISQIGEPAVVATTLAGNSAATAGSSSTPSASVPAAGSPSLTATVVADVNRALDAAGKFTCEAPGSWQPFPDLEIAFRVGEPPLNGPGCSSDVMELNYGTCAATPCSEMPADFVVRQLPDVPPDQFFVIVAPTLDPDGPSGLTRFFCVLSGVRQPVAALPSDTLPESACAAEPIGPTPDTVDIAPFPQGSGDIPLPPPPDSADIAASG